MRDFARSDSPAVQRQLDRLGRLSVPDGRLGLETIRALLDRLGNPQLRLPPVFHVAGTNGKGSTCAFLRAMLEAQGYRVHVTTSPHLVRYNERIRLAGKLIEDARLAELLCEVLDSGEDLNPSFFEVTIAAAFTEFARVPADACVVEVGLGGRFDATNVLGPEVLAACGIAALGIDHERFLLVPEAGAPTEPLARIAFEKAGIAKSGTPLVCLSYPGDARGEVMAAAARVAAPLAIQGEEWDTEIAEALRYRDERGELALPLPALPGLHQAQNAALAVALLRHQDRLPVSPAAIALGAGALARAPPAAGGWPPGRSARSLARRRAQSRRGQDAGRAFRGTTATPHHRHARRQGPRGADRTAGPRPGQHFGCARPRS
jgi:dihydrofolate synthase/folylpolyglutamate synthase